MFFWNRDRMDQVTAALESFLSLKSHETQRQYHQIFEGWESHLHGIPWHKATELNAIRYAKAEEKEGEVSKATVGRKVRILSKFYAGLLARGLVTLNPFAAVVSDYAKYRTGDIRPTQLIPFEWVPKILTAPPEGTLEGLRDRCFFTLLFGGALRIGEVSKLIIADVLISRDGVAVRLRGTKNGSNAEQHFADEFGAILRSYTEQRLREGGKLRDPLLVMYSRNFSWRNHHISTRELTRIWDRWTQHIGVPGSPSPHAARATAITRLIETLADQHRLDYREVRKFSRHSSVGMVEHYDKMRNDNAKKISTELSFVLPTKRETR